MNNVALDDRARAEFEKQSANWPSVIPWPELSEETRQYWRDHVTRTSKEKVRDLTTLIGNLRRERIGMCHDAANEIERLQREVADLRASYACATETNIAQSAKLRAAHEPGTAHFNTLQAGVKPWLDACFGPEVAGDRVERNHRFIEEALELVQACGCTREHAHQIVDYVYGRPSGDPFQEVGGVMVTLAALCLANGLDMDEAGATELQRVWFKIEQIRAKQAAKKKDSALPGGASLPPDDDLYILLVRRGYAQHEAFAISHMMPFPSGSAEPAGDAAAAAGAELTAALSTLQRIKGAFPEGDMRNHWVDLALIYLGPVAAEGASLTKEV